MISRGDRRIRTKYRGGDGQSGSSTISDDALIKLNSRNKSTNAALTQLVERQVDKYLMTVDKEARKNLSKTQIVRSREKVYLWEKAYSTYIETSESVPRDYLEDDCDPFSYIAKGKPTRKRKARHPSEYFNVTYDSFAFEKRFPTIEPEEVRCISRKEVSFEDWLKMRSDAYKLSKDVRSFLKRKPHMSTNEALNAFQERSHASMNEIISSLDYDGVPNQKLSTAELLALYIKEVKTREYVSDEEEMEKEG